jgi:hypothetical protein
LVLFVLDSLGKELGGIVFHPLLNTEGWSVLPGMMPNSLARALI